MPAFLSGLDGTAGAVMATAKAMRSHAVEMEVKLRERLAAAGVPDVGPDATQSRPNVKRLACYLGALDELFDTKAFGAYHNLMTSIARELRVSIFAEGDKVTVSAPEVPEDVFLTNKPFFVVNESLKHQLGAAHETGDDLRSEMATAAMKMSERETEHEARAKTLRRSQKTNVITGEEITQLRQEVADLREKLAVQSTASEQDKLHLQADIAYWRRTAQSSAAEHARLEHQAREEGNLRKAFDARIANADTYDPADAYGIEVKEALALIEQLGLLQGRRIDEYELAYETTSSESQMEALREAFVKEMNMIYAELIALQRFVVESEQRIAAVAKAVPENPVTVLAPVGDRFVARFLSGPVSGDVASSATPMQLEEQCKYVLGDRLLVPPSATHVQMLPPPHDPAALPEPQHDRARGRQSAGAVPAKRDGAHETIAGNSGLLMGESVLDQGRALEHVDRRSADSAATAGSDSATLLARVEEMEDEARRRDLASLDEETIAMFSTRWPQAKRSISLKALLRNIWQVFEGKLAAERENPLARRITLRDYYYRHTAQVYGSDSVVLIVARATLESLEVHAKSSPTVALFLKCLAGSCHDSVWHYHMWFRTRLNAQPIFSHRDFGVRLEQLYPSYRDLEVPTLVADYATGFPEANSETALEFLTAQLLQRTELRLRKWQKILRWKDVHNRNSFMHHEFENIAIKLFPCSSRELISAWYETVVAMTARPGELPHEMMTRPAPLGVLACVACCLEVDMS